MLNYVVFSLLIILGLLAILVDQSIGSPKATPYLTQIASTLLVGGTLSLLYKIFVDRETERRLARYLHIHESIVRAGLREIHMDARHYHFTELLAKAKDFHVVLNDGRRWVSTHQVEIEDRFSAEGTLTEFFFVDPNGPFVPALARKTGVTPDELKQKIQETLTLLEDAWSRSSGKGRLRVYGLKNFPTQSVFATGDRVIITTYQIASGRAVVPLFEYENVTGGHCIAGDFMADIDALRQESSTIMDKHGPVGTESS